MNPPHTDGRNIDPQIGVLEGEGSEQSGTRIEGPDASVAVWDSTSSEPFRERDDPGYFDVPLLKSTVWKADIPAYYYVGGVSGASAVLGAAACLLDGKDELQRINRMGRLVSLAGSAISAYLLIHDLGRPERFLHMLRVFRPTSPMNIGSWILSGFGAFAGFTCAALILPPMKHLERPAYLLLGLFGLGLSGYTGVLVANTAVPFWQGAHRTLPFLFMASAGASAASLFEALPLSSREHAVVRTFALWSKAAECAASLALESEVSTVSRVALPLRQGRTAVLWRLSQGCAAASLITTFFSKRSRIARYASALLGTAAGLGTRWAIHEGGRVSANDARATFHSQRQRPNA